MILLIKVNSALRQVPRRSFLLAPTYPILQPIPSVRSLYHFDTHHPDVGTVTAHRMLVEMQNDVLFDRL